MLFLFICIWAGTGERLQMILRRIDGKLANTNAQIFERAGRAKVSSFFIVFFSN